MYDWQEEETMQAAIVKPAVFDLFLAAVIAAYLGFLFLLVSVRILDLFWGMSNARFGDL